MKTVLLTIALLALAFLLLGVKALFVKGGKFPSGHAHRVMDEYKRRHSGDNPTTERKK